MKKAIAMRATQEDWDSIKGNFTENYTFNVNVYDFTNYPYLVNNGNNKENFIRNYRKSDMGNNAGRAFHETFNAKIFLEACGIETKPTLEEVKEKFKDAETVESIYGTKGIPQGNFHFDNNCYFCKTDKGVYLALWNPCKGYAKILTYKQQKFEITKEQILKLHKNEGSHYVKEWFPEVFKKELEVGKWYKNTRHTDLIVFAEKIQDENEVTGYGFNLYGNYINSSNGWGLADCVEATPQEVETALINEAKKRGFKENENISCYWEKEDITHSNMNGEFRFCQENNTLFIYNYVIFDKTGWATIIDTITIQEAEKLLNKKIVGL